MTALSGYSATLPTDVLLGSLVIYIDSQTAYGATQGEPTVNIPRTWSNLPYDGSLGIPMVGLDRKMYGETYIEGTFIEMNATKALDMEPGGATVSAGGIDTITPGTFGEFLAADQYKQNVRAVMRRGGGGVVVVEFDYGILSVDVINGASQGNGTVHLRFDARQAAGSAPGVAPYTIKLAASLSVIQLADT